MEVRAWHVHDGDPGEASVLIFATTRNRARQLATQSAWDFEYINTEAKLAPLWNQYATEEKIIEDNSELPEGAPRFYADWEPMFYV
jgi:hypothetical protein